MSILDLIKQLFGWNHSEVYPEPQNTEKISVDDCQNLASTLQDRPFEPITEGAIGIGITVTDDSLRKPDYLVVDDSLSPVVSELPPTDTHTEPSQPIGFSQETTDGVLSLLDNKPFMSLSESVCSIIEKIDDILAGTESIEVKKQLKFIKHKLREAFNNTGASTISDDTVFDGVRHVSVGDYLIKQGEPIEIVEDGLSIEERVMIPAKVKTNKNDLL